MSSAGYRYFLRSVNVLNLLIVAAIVIPAGYAIYPFIAADNRLSLPAVTERAMIQAEKPEPGPVAAASDYIVVAEKNLFHPDRVIPPEKKEDRPVPKPEIVLYGTLIQGKLRIAYVEDKKTPYSTPGRGQRQLALKIGDSLGGYVLKEIEEKRIVLSRGNDRIVVNLDDRDQKRMAEARPPASSAMNPAKPAQAPLSGPVPASQLAAPQSTSPYPIKSRRPVVQPRRPMAVPP